MLVLIALALSARSPAPLHDPAAHARDVAASARFVEAPPAAAWPADTRRVTVDARAVKRLEGARVTDGDIIRVEPVGGAWTVDTRSIRPVGAMGHVTEVDLHANWGDRRLVHTLPFGRLLLRVGDGPWLDAGSGLAIHTRAAGVVELAINDNASSLADNGGALDVMVSVPRGRWSGPADGPTSGGSSACKVATRALDELLYTLPTSCLSDDGCRVVAGFNPCNDAAPASAGPAAAPHVLKLDEARARAWKACGFVMPPCSTVPLSTRCVNHVCRVASSASPLPAPVPAPPRTPAPPPAPQDDAPPDNAGGKDGAPCNMDCGPGRRCVMRQVMCASAPCPPQPMCVER